MKVPFKTRDSVEFEKWWDKYPLGTYASIETEDVEEAYIAGFNACRDKWGGLTYKETLEQEEEKK